MTSIVPTYLIFIFRIDSIESRAFREFIMQSVIGKQTRRTKLVCIFTENAMA